MSEPRFCFVCAPSALAGSPAGWAQEMLKEGEIAVLASEGLEAINGVAHDLGRTNIVLIRNEADSEAQDRTVIGYARSLPVVWIAASFSEAATKWARDRGPMTLLVQSDSALGEEERRRIDRFVAILGRQSE